MELRFTQAARKHRIGRAHVRYVVATTSPTGTTTNQGNRAWLYIGTDTRGVELEVIAVELDAQTLLVTHVMPTALRRN